MARSDLLKQLFRSYKGRNDDAFLEAAREIVDEERKKNHEVLANELLRILNPGAATGLNGPKPSIPFRRMRIEVLLWWKLTSLTVFCRM